MNSLRIAIVGAGLGGLCLAQNLKQRGMCATVFERDKSAWDRPQGYRLHLDADGINALHDSLSSPLYQLFDATAMKAEPFTTIVDTALAVRARRPHDQHGGTAVPAHAGLPAHVNVDRGTLREILLDDIDVQWNKALRSYDENGRGVTLSFTDGTTFEADVLVGADGIRSPIRQQRAPRAQTQDSGVRAIYGRIPRDAAIAWVPEQARRDVFTVAIDERKCFFGLGPVMFPTPPQDAAQAAGVRMTPKSDYVVTIVGGRAALFGRDDETLRGLSSEALQALCLEMLATWPTSTREIIAHADPTAFFSVEMWTSVPTTLGKPQRTTLLGDAIHAMTPTLGRGANLAMRDGAMLGAHLARMDHANIAAELTAYETAMVPYGFEVVRAAAAMGAQLMGQEPLPQ